jgi:hypothetical protein
MTTMKRLLLLTLLSISSLQAQTGQKAAVTAKETQSGLWKNLTFAGVALVTVAAGVVACAVDNGQTTH